MFKKLAICFIVIILFHGFGRAQFFTVGNEPAHQKWQVMQNDRLVLLYPDSLGEAAAQWFCELDSALQINSLSLGVKSRKLFVVMHPNMAESNGLVAWAPSRMELYTTPPQEFCPGNWIGMLAWHESRHYAQLSSMYFGDTKLLYSLFGEQLIAAIYGIYVPWWFTEGDAVRSETAWLPVGRGRQPSFSMDIAVQAVEGCKINYDKGVLGSFNDYFPNQYTLGYWMTSCGAFWYGDTLWPMVLRNVAENPGQLTPFNKMIRKASGKGKRWLFTHTMDSLAIWVSSRNQQRPISPPAYISTDKQREYALLIPVAQADTESIYIWQRSMHGEPLLIQQFGNGKSRRVIEPGNVQDNDFGYGGQWIVWIEGVPDMRWQLRQKTRLHFFNPISKTHYRKMTDGLAFSPDIDDACEKLVYIRVGADSRPSILISSFMNLDDSKAFVVPDSIFPADPVFGKNSSQIYFIGNSYSGNGLYLLNTISGDIECVLPVSKAELSDLSYGAGCLYFSYALKGVNEIFRLSPSNGKLEQLSCTPYGAFNPLIVDDKLFYSVYGLNGLRVACIGADTLKVIENDPGFSVYDSIATLNSNMERNKLLKNKDYGNLYSDSSSSIEINRYQRGKHLFRFHSWGLLSTDAAETEVNPGLAILSQNLLSTMSFTLSSRYRWSDQMLMSKADVSYTGLFPRIRLQAGQDRRLRESNGLYKTHNYSILSVDQPLNLSRGKHLRLLLPSLGLAIHDINYTVVGDDFEIASWRVQLDAYDMLRTNSRNLFPKAGLYTSLGMEQTIAFPSSTNGRLKWGDATVFIPGAFRHDGFRLYAGMQKADSSYSYSNSNILYPRGYSPSSESEIASLRFDYRTPLFYPDISVGSLLYIKRIQGGLIFDEAFVNDHKAFMAAGIFLGADYHLLRFPAPVYSNFYCTYDFYNNNWYAGVGFGISFYDM